MSKKFETDEERSEFFRQKIKETKPWEKATGPKTKMGKKIVSTNAIKTGQHSRDAKLRAKAILFRALEDETRASKLKAILTIDAFTEFLDSIEEDKDEVKFMIDETIYRGENEHIYL